MCGILGITAQKKYPAGHLREMAEILLKLSESRGKEAAGFAVKKKDSINIIKLPLGVSDFLKSNQYKEFSKSSFEGALSIIGHSRLATHGSEYDNENNQPVVKDKAVGVHNGIIANDEKLWQLYPQLKREYRVDTEVLLSLLQLFGVKKTFEVIEGSASIAVFFNNNYSLVLATNTGSLYTLENPSKDAFIFASERYILEQFIKRTRHIDSFQPEQIQQLLPGSCLIIDILTLTKSTPENSSIVSHPEVIIGSSFKLSPETKKAMQDNWEKLYSLYDQGKIKRCSKCLLPETMTFIDFDEHGVCNYCRNHKKIEVKGETALEEAVAKYRRNDGRPDCIVGFSGGRDSSYGLHYIKKVLKMNPIAYIYDWGMITDLGRKNQARICGKLGVEQIIVSADIRRKRANILANIEAWLRKPEMGTTTILMAGDKQLHYHAEQLKKKMGTNLLIHCCGGGFENEFFKIGLTGVFTTSDIPLEELPLSSKLRMAAYYASQYIRNPSYFNRSLLDTVFAYYSNFFLPSDSVQLYRYIRWNEQEILSTIINEYNWETEPNTSVTWRIDDGTSVFYNYIYLTVMGFTEFDTLRSIQIREGDITREEAYRMVKEENKPRYELAEWYAKVIGFDINKAIKRINEIPKFYSNGVYRKT